MKLPRHAEIWLKPYISDRFHHWTEDKVPCKRVWFAIVDHFEPLWHGADLKTGVERLARWQQQWPEIAKASARDSMGSSPQYTFFFPEEQYHRDLLGPLASMTHAGLADVEVHIHHDREGRGNFVQRVTRYCKVLEEEHGLLRRCDGQLRFGFVHGNWALDNSLPGGRFCGLNDEITILRDLGCYADFTMPSGDSPSQSRMVNTIYWATDDPNGPKSYDTGKPLLPGGGVEGDLLMIPGPLGLRWAERLLPRIEAGDISASDPPTAYRVSRWFALAPRIGSDLFIKVHTHGMQERNSAMLLGGGLQNLFTWLKEEAARRSCDVYFVTAWQMYRAVDALRTRKDPVAAIARPLS